MTDTAKHHPSACRCCYIFLSLLIIVNMCRISTHALSIPLTQSLKTASGLPISRYGLGGAARSTQPASLPALYLERLLNSNDDDDDDDDGNRYKNGAPFLFYYNPHRYPDFMSGVKQLCSPEESSTVDRSDLFIAGGGTDRSAHQLDQRLSDCLEYSGGTYLDCFVLEYVCPEELAVDAAAPWNPDPMMRLQPHPDLAAAIEHVRRWVDEGKVRYVGISTHSHVVGAVLARESDVDALMIRYNLSHKDAAEEVTFPAARENGKPVIAFTTTRWNSLQGDGTYDAPSTADCLSFVLGNRSCPPVEAVLHSARDEDELNEAMEGIRMGLNEDADAKWRTYGEVIEDSNEDYFDEYPEERYLKASAA